MVLESCLSVTGSDALITDICQQTDLQATGVQVFAYLTARGYSVLSLPCRAKTHTTCRTVSG